MTWELIYQPAGTVPYSVVSWLVNADAFYFMCKPHLLHEIVWPATWRISSQIMVLNWGPRSQLWWLPSNRNPHWLLQFDPNHLDPRSISKNIKPFLKLTARTWKWVVGILVSFWDGLFSGAMLVSGRVHIYKHVYLYIYIITYKVSAQDQV